MSMGDSKNLRLVTVALMPGMKPERAGNGVGIGVRVGETMIGKRLSTRVAVGLGVAVTITTLGVVVGNGVNVGLGVAVGNGV